jgi:hypothetical protein
MVTHPHPNLPLEGEGVFSLLPLQGEGREGDGVTKHNAMVKCDEVELSILMSWQVLSDTGIELVKPWEACFLPFPSEP